MKDSFFKQRLTIFLKICLNRVRLVLKRLIRHVGSGQDSRFQFSNRKLFFMAIINFKLIKAEFYSTFFGTQLRLFYDLLGVLLFSVNLGYVP